MALQLCDQVSLAGFGYDMHHPESRLHYYETIRMDSMKAQVSLDQWWNRFQEAPELYGIYLLVSNPGGAWHQRWKTFLEGLGVFRSRDRPHRSPLSWRMMMQWTLHALPTSCCELLLHRTLLSMVWPLIRSQPPGLTDDYKCERTVKTSNSNSMDLIYQRM